MMSCSPRIFPESTDTKDSVKVVKVVEYRDTMINITLPKEKTVNKTIDSISHLRTSVAESVAEIRDGKLHHSLKNLDELLVPVPMIITNVDTNREKVIRDVVVREVEKNLNGWQKTIMTLGYVLFGTIIIALVIFILKIIIGFK